MNKLIFIFQKKNSQLGTVAKAELVQDRAQVVSHRSFAQVQVLGNFFVAHSLGDRCGRFSRENFSARSGDAGVLR